MTRIIRARIALLRLLQQQRIQPFVVVLRAAQAIVFNLRKVEIQCLLLSASEHAREGRLLGRHGGHVVLDGSLNVTHLVQQRLARNLHACTRGDDERMLDALTLTQQALVVAT
ncbi:MAG: hypothetical protein QM756_43730 [Polyangiaceae bacterium]